MASLLESTIYSLKKSIRSIKPFEIEKDEDKIVFYRCSVCGHRSSGIGFLHAHMETHTPWYSVANVEKFKEWTEKIIVTEYDVKDIEDFSKEAI